MATEEHEATDRHDESDRAQFGDDHNLDGTHFIATHCQECGTYVVRAPEATQALCIDCRRTQAGITWQSGDNIGDHHPTTRQDTYRNTHTTTTKTTHNNGKTSWQWGCLYCLETGPADNHTHATALHNIHLGYACPGAPGLNTTQIRERIARRKTKENLYPTTTPPFTPNNK